MMCEVMCEVCGSVEEHVRRCVVVWRHLQSTNTLNKTVEFTSI